MLTDCGNNVTWHNLNKATVKSNNGYIHLHQQPPSAESIIMDYESSSDAALLVQEQSQPTLLNRDTSTVLLLDANQPKSPQPHSNIINNPTVVPASPVNANLTSPQHAATSSLRKNSISPISTSPTNPTNKSQVIVNLDYPNSNQTITTLQRNNVKNSSTKSNRSQVNAISTSSTIGNSIKAGDNGKIFKANNNRKYKFNLLKLSSSTRIERSTRIRLLILAICLIVFGIAIGAFIVHLSGIYPCSPGRIGMYI